ncbi:fatty acyl-CoA reductase 1-like [Onthophagus taurus]|uniref:fatty acyl-CoA reductase 1-like n=1 Tax=Onthophagus taurus TaxID=166361 RepID=UPI0039BDC125
MRSPIVEFYTGKTVFITGATGFMGKVLLEKLIRSVPDIKKIYILLRPKKGYTPKERIKQLTNSDIFTFNDLNEKANEKIEAVCGDITKEGFDMSLNDREKLVDEVSVVFHIAASVRMDLSLKEAVITNTKSTYELFKFCMDMKNLQSVVHLSTAYCNVEIENMEEKVYPIDVDPYKIIDIVEWMDEKCLNVITKRLLGPHPNTYTFTKRLAEIIAVDMGDKIPLIITRPSIVVPSLSEPTPGWVDNFYGPMGMFVASAKGILKSGLVDGDSVPEVIPVDFAINSVICCGYERAKTNYLSTPTINITNRFPYTWRYITDVFVATARKEPFKHALWYPEIYITKSYCIFMTVSFIFQLIPALLVDFILIIFFQKPFLVTIQKRLMLSMQTVRHFTVRKWTFDNSKCIKLEEKLDKADKEIFYGVITKDVDLKEYAVNSYNAVKKYLLNDDSKNIELYRLRNKIFYFLNLFIKFYLLYVVLNWCYVCLSYWF